MKVWHDDNRYPPADDWEWAKDNETAMSLLTNYDVQIISIDMDLGAVEGKDFNYGKEWGGCYRGEQWRSVDWLRNMNNDPGENGVDLAKWMVENRLLPPRIIIHTWNGWGGDAIAQCFKDVGHTNVERIFWSQSLDHIQRVYA